MTLAALLLSVLAIVLLLTDADAAEPKPPTVSKVVRVSSAGPARDSCVESQRAITYYRKAYREHRTTMGLEGPVPRVWYRACEAVRRRAVEWRDRAAAAREALGAWKRYHYAWWEWLPDKWQRVGACETGYGRRPGNWRHSNSAYEGAFGFALSSWDGFVGSADPKAGPYPHAAYLATPRQQYEVALAIWRRYGFSGWGCRGA